MEQGTLTLLQRAHAGHTKAMVSTPLRRCATSLRDHPHHSENE